MLDTAHANQVVAATVGAVCIGIVQNSPAAGGYAKVRYSGVGIVKVATSITVGMLLEADGTVSAKQAVATTVSGSATTGGNILGQALSAGSSGTIQIFIQIGGCTPGTNA